MGLFDKNTVSPEVAECDRQIAAIAARRNQIIYAVGQQFVSTTTARQVQGTPYADMLMEYEQLNVQEAMYEKKKLAAKGLRKCDKCGNILVIDSMFCNMCGEKFERYVDDGAVQQQQGQAVCPQCGNPYSPGAAFCRTCGFKLDSTMM